MGVINELTSRNSKSSFVKEIKLEDVTVTDSPGLANAFNNHFVTIGQKLAEEIPSNINNCSPLHYLSGHLRDLESFQLKTIDNSTVFSYGAVSGSKIREHLFGTMLRHNDTTLWPVSMALRHSYTTFSLHNRIFWLHSWAVRRNDVTFRLYYMTFRRQSRRSVIMNCRTIVTRGKRVKNDTMFWLHFNPDICVRSDAYIR